MNTSTTTKSTYALLMESQSRKANAFEDIAYCLMILSVVFSIIQCGTQSLGAVPLRKVAGVAQAAASQRGS